MIKINLLPVRAAKKKENIRQQLSIAILSIILSLFGWGWYQITLINKVNRTEEEIASIKKELDAMKLQAEELKKFKEKKEIFEKKFNIIKKLRENKNHPVHLLDDLSHSIPGFLWLTSFTQVEKEKSSEIQIKGKAFSNEAIAQFMENLENSPYYANVNLKVSEQTDLKKGSKGSSGKNQGIREFTITCQVEHAKDEITKDEKFSRKGTTVGN